MKTINKTKYVTWAEKMNQKEFEDTFNNWLDNNLISLTDTRNNDDNVIRTYEATILNSRKKHVQGVTIRIETMNDDFFVEKNGMDKEKKGWTKWGDYTGKFSLVSADRLYI